MIVKKKLIPDDFDQIVQNYFSSCWHCHQSLTLSWLQFSYQTTIHHQTFVFFKCQHCQNLLYYWKNAQNQVFLCPKFNIVLVAPEIVGNVGTIMRLSVGFAFQVHLIQPFGFIFSEKWLKRSSIGNFNLAAVQVYENWADFQAKNFQGEFFFTSAKAKKSLTEIDFSCYTKPIYLIFGCESKGLPICLKKQYWAKTIRLKQTNLINSINLANAVAIFSHYGLIQYQYLGLI